MNNNFYKQMKEMSKKYDTVYRTLIYPEAKQDILNMIRNRETLLSLYDFKIIVYDDYLNSIYTFINVYCYIVNNHDENYTLSFYVKQKVDTIYANLHNYIVAYKTKQENSYKILFYCNAEEDIDDYEGVVTVNSFNDFAFNINDIDNIVSKQDKLLNHDYEVIRITGTGTLAKFLKLSTCHKRPTNMCFVNPDINNTSYCYLIEKDYNDVMIKLCIDDKMYTDT
jgi:hypothetical protein